MRCLEPSAPLWRHVRLWELRKCLQAFAWQKWQPGPPRWWLAYSIYIKYNWRYFKALCIPIPGIFPLELLSSMKTIHPMEIIQHLWNVVKNKRKIQLVIRQSSCCENITYLQTMGLLKKKKNHTIHFFTFWMKTVSVNSILRRTKCLRMKETISRRNSSVFQYKDLLSGYDNFSKPQTKYHSMLICSFTAGNLRHPITLQCVHSCLV